jgi:hypothetical protein
MKMKKEIALNVFFPNGTRATYTMGIKNSLNEVADMIVSDKRIVVYLKKSGAKITFYGLAFSLQETETPMKDETQS